MKLKPLHVLLVEDQPNEIIIMQQAAREIGDGLRLNAVHDGKEATDFFLRKGRFSRTEFPLPDLIVTDLNMPRMDGLELLRWLQNHRSYDSVRRIVMSDSASSEEIAEAYRLGVATCLKKPIGVAGSRKVLEAIQSFWARCESVAIRKHENQ